jgi:hypothetical protein
MSDTITSQPAAFSCHRYPDKSGQYLCHDCRNTFCQEYTVEYEGVHFCLDCFNAYYHKPDLALDLPGGGTFSRSRVVLWIICLLVAGCALGMLLPLPWQGQ